MAGTDAAIANTRHDSAYLPSSTHAKPDNKHTAQQHTHRHTTVQAGLCWVTFSPHQREQHNPHPTPLNAVVVIPVPYSLPAVNTVPMVQNPATMESSMPRRFVGRYSVYSVNTVGMEPPTPMPAITRHPANMTQPVVTGHRSKHTSGRHGRVCCRRVVQKTQIKQRNGGNGSGPPLESRVVAHDPPTGRQTGYNTCVLHAHSNRTRCKCRENGEHGVDDQGNQQARLPANPVGH